MPPEEMKYRATFQGCSLTDWVITCYQHHRSMCTLALGVRLFLPARGGAGGLAAMGGSPWSSPACSCCELCRWAAPGRSWQAGGCCALGKDRFGGWSGAQGGCPRRGWVCGDGMWPSACWAGERELVQAPSRPSVRPRRRSARGCCAGLGVVRRLLRLAEQRLWLWPGFALVLGSPCLQPAERYAGHKLALLHTRISPCPGRFASSPGAVQEANPGSSEGCSSWAWLPTKTPLPNGHPALCAPREQLLLAGPKPPTALMGPCRLVAPVPAPPVLPDQTLPAAKGSKKPTPPLWLSPELAGGTGISCPLLVITCPLLALSEQFVASP